MKNRRNPLSPIILIIVFISFSSLLLFQKYLSSHRFNNTIFAGSKQQYHIHKKSQVKCIRAYDYATREGIGAIITRNNLLFFLAQVFSADISWGFQESKHQYNVNELFSSCPTPSPSCVFYEPHSIIPRCPRGDCLCLWNNALPAIQNFTKECDVMGVRATYFRSTEHFGCFPDPLVRYFVNRTQPGFSYDAIHYRMGDLADKPGGKSFSPLELYALLNMFCILSDRPLVLITEGNPKIPKVDCIDRIIIAGDTSIHDAFSIMRYASFISVGDSTFAIALAAVSQPKRMIILQRSISRYDWLQLDNWTIVDSLGVPFHFNNKELMLNSMAHTLHSWARSHRFANERNLTFTMDYARVVYDESFWA